MKGILLFLFGFAAFEYVLSLGQCTSLPCVVDLQTITEDHPIPDFYYTLISFTMILLYGLGIFYFIQNCVRHKSIIAVYLEIELNETNSPTKNLFDAIEQIKAKKRFYQNLIIFSTALVIVSLCLSIVLPIFPLIGMIILGVSGKSQVLKIQKMLNYYLMEIKELPKLDETKSKDLT